MFSHSAKRRYSHTKTAILVVSLGTSYAQAERECIAPTEDAFRAAYPAYPVFRAFTSEMIVRKLRCQGRAIADEGEAIAQLKAEGYDDIAVVTTNVISGHEYELIREAAQGLKVSAPLLYNAADIEWMAGLLGDIASREGRPLLVMGHGTDHAANETYVRLRDMLPANVFIACAKGENALSSILPELEALSEKRLLLMPLMLVAGHHAHNDIAGDDSASWKSILEARHFEVGIRMQGLGALKAVQRRFLEKGAEIIGK